jgi:hypothetical protein
VADCSAAADTHYRLLGLTLPIERRRNLVRMLFNDLERSLREAGSIRERLDQAEDYLNER